MTFSSRMNQSKSKSKLQAGLTLIETLVSLAIFALVVGGALALFNSASSSQTTTQMTSDLSAIRSATKQLFFGQGGYGNVDLNSVLINSKKVPATMTALIATPFTITHSQSGTVLVTGATANFTIKVTGISKDVCIGILGTPGWTGVMVGAVAVTLPVNPVSASAACTGPTNDITFTSV